MLRSGRKAGFYVLTVIIVILLVAPAGLMTFEFGKSATEKNTTFLTRAGFDVGVVSMVKPDPDHSHSKVKQNITANIKNYDTDSGNNIWANVTVKRVSLGIFEGVTGNASYTLTANENKEIYFEWTPSTDSNLYIINISVTCLSGPDPDLTNNYLETEILINTGLDSKPEIITHTDGASYAKTPQTVKATVWNYGTVKITENFYTSLDIKDQSATSVFSDLVLIDVSSPGSDIQVSGNTTTVTFADWVPSTTGTYTIDVETRLVGDTYWTNNVSSVGITISDMIVAGVKVVSLEPTIQVIPPGQNTLSAPYTAFRFKIQNRGSQVDKFNWTATSGHDWILGNNPTTGTTAMLNPNEWSPEISIDIAVPSAASMSMVDDLVLEAVSWNNPAVLDSNLSRTYTQEVHDMVVTPPNSKWGTPGGDPLMYVFKVTNTGNVGERFELFLGGNQSGWPARIHMWETDYLDPGESDWILTEIEIPELNFDTRVKDKTFYGASGFLTLNARSKYTGAVKSGTVYTFVNLIYTADIKVVPKTQTMQRNETVQTDIEFQLHVRNVCNREEVVTEGESDINLSVSEETPSFYLAWDGYDETESKRWKASLSYPKMHLRMGDWNNNSILLVKAPGDEFHGYCEVNVTASSTGDGGGFGIEVNSTASARVYVNQSAGVSVTPPVNDYYTVYDNNTNGISDWAEGAPLDTVYLKFNVSNLGNGRDRYLLDAWAVPIGNHTLPEDWHIEFPRTNISNYLIPRSFNTSSSDHFQLAQVNVTIPGGLEINSKCKVFLKAASLFNLNVTAVAEFIINVKQGYAVILDPEINQSFIMPNETVVYNINVTNAGNGPDTIRISLDFEPLPNWQIILPSEFKVLTMNRSAVRRIWVSVTPDREADASQSLEITATGRSVNDEDKYDDIKMITTVKQIAEVELVPLEPSVQHGIPGKTLKFRFQIENTGNAKDSFVVSARNRYNWTMKFENPGQIGQTTTLPPIPLEKDETKVFNVTIRIPPLSAEPTLTELIGNGTMAFTVNELVINATSYFDPGVTNLTNASVIVDHLSRARLYTAKNSHSVMPGRSVVYNVTIRNTGNYQDVYNITVGYPDDEAQNKYGSWWKLSESFIKLNVTLTTTFDFTVEPPDISGGPHLHEEILLILYANSQKMEDPLDALTTHTKIIMIASEVEEVEVDFGMSTTFTVSVMNVPTMDGYTGPFYVYCLDSRTNEKPVWDVEYDPVINFDTNHYNPVDIDFTVTAPITIDEYEPTSLRLEISVVRANETGPVPDMVKVKISLTYFDVFVDNVLIYESGTNSTVNMNELEEGTKVDLRIVVTCVGKRPQDNIHINLYLNDEMVESLFIETSDPVDKPGRKETHYLNHTLKIETLPWATKQEDYSLELRVDEEGDIFENGAMGDHLGAEENNLFKADMKVNDSSVHIGISLTLIFLLLFLVLALVFIVYYKERRPYLVIVLALVVGVLGFLFFSIPWGSMDLTTTWVNTIGWIILGATFLFLLLVLGLSLRSTYPYLKYRLKEMEDINKKNQDRRRDRLGIGPPITKGGGEGEDDKDLDEEREEMFSNQFIPYAIILGTAVAGLFALFLLSGIVLAISTGDAVDAASPFIDWFIIIPNLAIMVLFLFIGIVMIVLVQRGQVRALDEIMEADNIIERLKKDAERRMYSDENADYYDDYERAFRDSDREGAEEEDYYDEEGGGGY